MMKKMYRIIRKALNKERVIGVYEDEDECDIHMAMCINFIPTYIKYHKYTPEFKKEEFIQNGV